MADSRAEEWLKRGDRAFEESQQMMQLYERLREIFYPDRQSFISRRSTGEEGYDAISDGYPILMRGQLANAIGSMSRPRGREWFRPRAAQWKLNDKKHILDWCDEAGEIQRKIVYHPRAQFAAQKAASDNDYVTFGTAVEKTTLNNDVTGVLFRCLHLADVAGEQNSEGVIDVTHERMCYTARAVDELAGPKATLSRRIKDLIKKDPLEEVELRFCCGPVKQYEPGKRRPFRGAKYFGLLMDPETMTVIREEFFTSFPYLWRRFMQVSGEIWGRSPSAMASLGDSRMLQEIDSSMAEAIERAANPGWLIASDGVIGDPDLAPAGVTFAKEGYDFRTGRPIEPVPTGTQPGWGFEYRKDKREYVARAWLQDVLRLPVDQDMTAYEVAERIEEFIRTAAPIFEPMEAENAIQQARVFDLSDTHGAFPARPDELRGGEIVFEFDTPLSIAFDKLRVQQGVQVMQTTEQLAAFDEGAKLRVDWAAMQRDIMKGLGPSRWMRKEEEAEEEAAALAQKRELESALMLGKESGLTDLLAADATGGAPALPAPGGAQPGAIDLTTAQDALVPA